jgi:hypothetical protein
MMKTNPLRRLLALIVVVVAAAALAAPTVSAYPVDGNGDGAGPVLVRSTQAGHSTKKKTKRTRRGNRPSAPCGHSSRAVAQLCPVSP